MHYINTTPAFLKLYQTAEREAQRFGNSLTIRVLSPDEVPWGGACPYARGEIWLSEGRDSTSDFLIMAIFELANMVQAQKFHALGVRLAKGTIGREGYARAMEAIERISQKIHAKVFAIAAVQEQDPRRAELFIQCAAYYLEANQETEEQDFERNKANGHAEPYYQHWDLCISMEALVEYYPDEISHVVQMPNRETEFFEYVV
jgi:hypothetical protein